MHDVTATDDGTGVINFGDEDIDAVLQQEQGDGEDPGLDQIKINRVTHHPPPPPVPPHPVDEGEDLAQASIEFSILKKTPNPCKSKIQGENSYFWQILLDISAV